MSASRWWECTHADIGLPGCPTCDGRLDPLAREALAAARDEIQRLTSHAAIERKSLCHDINTARDYLLSGSKSLALASGRAAGWSKEDAVLVRQRWRDVDRMRAASVRDVAERTMRWMRDYIDGRPLRDWRRW